MTPQRYWICVDRALLVDALSILDLLFEEVPDRRPPQREGCTVVGGWVPTRRDFGYRRQSPLPLWELRDGTHTWLTWDNYRDGFGLVSVLGREGWILRQTLIITWLRRRCGERMRVRTSANAVKIIITGDRDMPELEITIKNGAAKIDVIGASGSDCLKSIPEELQNAIGAVQQEEFKPEYYQPAQEQEQEQRQHG